MDLKKIFDKCFEDIGGKENEYVKWYLYERPKNISRESFFTEVVNTIWTSGFKWERAKEIIEKAKKVGLIPDYNFFSSLEESSLDELIEKLHGKPIPKLARRKWKAIHEIARELKKFSSEEDFCKSFFDGKTRSEELDKKDVKRLSDLRLPFIRKANAQHIIRNMGGEVIKCDIWIKAFLGHYKISLNELESELQKLKIPLGFFDLVVWAYCERFVKKVSKFNEHFKRVFSDN